MVVSRSNGANDIRAVNPLWPSVKVIKQDGFSLVHQWFSPVSGESVIPRSGGVFSVITVSRNGMPPTTDHHCGIEFGPDAT